MSTLYPILHLLIAIIELVVIWFAVKLCRNSVSVAMIVLPIVLASMIYDNTVLGLGNLIGVGETLKTLSFVRFFVHYLVVPLFVVIGVELAHRAGARWATTVTRSLSWLVAFGLATTDIFTKFVSIKLEPVMFMGVLRYANAQSGSVPIITIIVNVFMILIGIGLWIRLKWPWLFWGSIFSFVGNAIPISLIGTIVGSASELAIGICLFLAERYTQFTRKS
jgi:hypothetical protein